MSAGAKICGLSTPDTVKAAFDAFDRKDAAAIAYGPLVVIVVTATRGFALVLPPPSA